MAGDKKISNLDAAGTLASSDYIALTQSGVTVKALLSNLLTYLGSFLTTLGSLTSVGVITSGTWNAKTQKRIKTAASASSLTPNIDTDDLVRLTLLAANITFNNPSGTPTEGQELDIRITSDATPRTISFDTNYRFSTDLPNTGTTTVSRTIYFRFKYNATATKWDCLTILDNF